jgi:hypothetical protein
MRTPEEKKHDCLMMLDLMRQEVEKGNENEQFMIFRVHKVLETTQVSPGIGTKEVMVHAIVWNLPAPEAIQLLNGQLNHMMKQISGQLFDMLFGKKPEDDWTK